MVIIDRSRGYLQRHRRPKGPTVRDSGVQRPERHTCSLELRDMYRIGHVEFGVGDELDRDVVHHLWREGVESRVMCPYMVIRSWTNDELDRDVVHHLWREGVESRVMCPYMVIRSWTNDELDRDVAPPCPLGSRNPRDTHTRPGEPARGERGLYVHIW
jgi:hypothetical protein